MESTRITFFRKWHGVTLEDWGSVISKEYNDFQNAQGRLFRKIAKEIGAKLVSYHKMHYDESAMFERNGKFVYIYRTNNLSNRSRPVFHHILIRTARHAEDWTGGPNDYVNWSGLVNKLDKMLGGDGNIEDENKFPFKQRYPETMYDQG